MEFTISRLALLNKFLDIVFHNRSVSLGKDGKLNNIDNRFDKCTFTIPYRDMLLKILEIIICEPTVVIKNRNTKRNGEYTEISHSEILRRLSDFLKYLLGIDISLYYKMANDEFNISKAATSTLKVNTNNKDREKIAPMSQEQLTFTIISDIILLAVFNKEKIGKKEDGYGNINIEELKNFMISKLNALCNIEYMFLKLKYPITTWLIYGIRFNVKTEDKKIIFDNEELKNRSITYLLQELDSKDIEEKMKTGIRGYVIKNRSELLTIRDDLMIKIYWETIENFHSYNKSKVILGRREKKSNEYYYFREYMLMLEEIITSNYMDYFIMTFDKYKSSYQKSSYQNGESNNPKESIGGI